MTATKHWSVDNAIGVHGGRTRAEARRNTHNDMIVTGGRDARRNQAYEDIPNPGNEFAAARG